MYELIDTSTPMLSDSRNQKNFFLEPDFQALAVGFD
jgi:hypothetical protein